MSTLELLANKQSAALALRIATLLDCLGGVPSVGDTLDASPILSGFKLSIDDVLAAGDI